MKKRIRLKASILKKIELKNKNKMNDRDRLRIFGDGKKPIDITLMTRDEMRHTEIIKDTYNKKAFVDYDVVICIPSYNRYDKVKRLMNQFFEQKTKYTFKIVLLNDGSTDIRYNNFNDEFTDIQILKNDKPNGKVLHWYCYNQLWETLKIIDCHVILQMDDDFILSDLFLDNIIDLYFKEKENNNKVMGIAPHLWSFNKKSDKESWWSTNNFVDGIALLDDNVIKFMNYEMKPVDAVAVSKPGTPVRAWTQVSQAIKNMNGILYRTNVSLVYHDGNDDSKLHGDLRKDGKGGVYTQKYIGKL